MTLVTYSGVTSVAANAIDMAYEGTNVSAPNFIQWRTAGDSYAVNAFSGAADIMFTAGATAQDDVISGSAVSLTLSQVPSSAAIGFTNLAGPVSLADLVDPANTSGAPGEMFWRPLLAGATTFVFDNGASGNQIAGDFLSVQVDESVVGAADSFDVEVGSNMNRLAGDAEIVLKGASLVGGNDVFRGIGLAAGEVFGDAGVVGGSSSVTSVVGGDDDILIEFGTMGPAQAYGVGFLIGDVGMQTGVNASTTGGDDHIRITGRFDTVQAAIGDVGTNQTGSVQGGQDVIEFGLPGFVSTDGSNYMLISGDGDVSGDPGDTTEDSAFVGGDDVITSYNANNVVGDVVGDLRSSYYDSNFVGGNDQISLLFDLPLTSAFQIFQTSISSAVAGDATTVTGSDFVGGDDMLTIELPLTSGQITGDVRDISDAGAFVGGDDVIAYSNAHGSGFAADFYGDADTLNGSGAGMFDFVGGDDVITIALTNSTSLEEMTATGDVRQVTAGIGGSAVGGDDVIRVMSMATTPNTPEGGARIYGDFDTVSGEQGTQSLTVGFGDDILVGGRGDDRIYGDFESLSDVDTVGPGGQDMLDGREGNDLLFGNTGIDTAIFSLPQSVLVDLDGFDLGASGSYHAIGQGLDQLFQIENIVGSSEADVIRGNVFSNVIDGLGGDDILEGRGGAADVLNGGAGVDTLSYSSSTGSVSVRIFNGTASGGHATGDTFTSIENLNGGSGNDYLAGNSGANVLRGGFGHDQLRGGSSDDVLEGGAGADNIDGQNGMDTLSYEGDSTGVSVRIFNGTASGGHAAGDVFASIENLTGGAGGDFLVGNSGANVIRGGGDNDQLRGGSGDDQLFGEAADDMLFGQNGADRLDGGAGDDTLYGGPDADVLIGGAGVDAIDYGDDAVGVDVRLFMSVGVGGEAAGDTFSQVENIFGGSANDYLAGNSAANFLRGRGGDDTLLGGSNDDLIEGGAGADMMNGGTGIDTLCYEFSSAGVNVRLFNNFAANGDAAGDMIGEFENIIGSQFNDYLAGDDEVNVLTGLAGNDQLRGGGGDDVLIGGDGVDTYVGAGGADRHVFDTALGFVDVVQGFSVADADRFVLSHDIFTELTFAGAETTLDATEFHVGAAAASFTHRIIYDDTTGALSYDPDGDDPAGPVQFATLATGLALTNAEFLLI